MSVAKIVHRSEKSFQVEIEVSYKKSILEGEEAIQEAINQAGCLMTGEMLCQFDTDGSPIMIGGVKWTSKGLISKTYQTPYGEAEIERQIYQSLKGGAGFCPLERDARIILTATPKFAKILASKYAEFGSSRVNDDLEGNHGRKVARSFIQNVCDPVGAVAIAKEGEWEYAVPETEKPIKTISVGLDGTCMLMMEEGYRQAMVGTIALFDKEGERQFWKKAFDEMAKQFKKHYAELGPKGVAIFGSGQYTIMEGYTSAKLMKAGFRSNNIDPNARLCMASAVAAFMETIGIDEPAGNYDDMHHSDTIVLWGANMAEMHPVLWSKITNRKLADPGRVKVVNLTTFTNRCSNLADSEIVFKPGTDLAIQNYILREIVNRPGAVDWEFVNHNCVFTTGYVYIGYGLRPKIDHPKYKKEELDTASKESFKIITKDEAVAMGTLVRQPARAKQSA